MTRSRGLAEVYRKLNRPAEAEATYRKAIELRAAILGGYSWLGAFYRGGKADTKMPPECSRKS
jgi:hypothetical protein